ncbi:response regulator [Chryseosolibacter indicus]|uniref:Response regulator n=1 Tax=Chryseosolibacter indicus TaxID=2782351 RepID=A0ABS5VVE3_9BACT|nr:response regulator [Chryseosolibacter indicus]MBT1705407.1 response regulator [Chryseosolibacter indicus]
MQPSEPIIAVIDDDKIFQLTASKTIKAAELTDKILQFENGEEALSFLKDNQSNPSSLPDYIFLDINMPFVDGWMFLEDFDKIKTALAKRMVIYMVSSSIDPRDMNRAKGNSNVTDYVIKPVTIEKFKQLLQRAAA